MEEIDEIIEIYTLPGDDEVIWMDDVDYEDS